MIENDIYIYHRFTPNIRWISPIGYFFHIPHFVYLRQVTWNSLHIINVTQNQPLWLQFLSFNYSSQWKTEIVTNGSLNFVPRQTESKIRHMTFHDLVNKVPWSSSKYNHMRSMTANLTGRKNSEGKLHYAQRCIY